MQADLTGFRDRAPFIAHDQLLDQRGRFIPPSPKMTRLRIFLFGNAKIGALL